MSAPYIDPIPNGWEMRFDDTTQTYYFIDHKNQRTQWQHPVNKLIYRPAQVQSGARPNGQQSTPITINRQPVSALQNRTFTTQFQPAELSATNVSGNLAQEQSPTSTSFNSSNQPVQEPELPQKDNDTMLIDKVLEKAKPIIAEVDSFKGVTGDKNYLRLMECLEVLILELDGIGVDGSDVIRAARRSAVKELQQAIEMLEFRSQSNSEEPAGVDNEANPPALSTMSAEENT